MRKWCHSDFVYVTTKSGVDKEGKGLWSLVDYEDTSMLTEVRIVKRTRYIRDYNGH